MTGNQRVVEGRARRIDGASAIAVGRTQVAKSVSHSVAGSLSVGRSIGRDAAAAPFPAPRAWLPAEARLRPLHGLHGLAAA